MPEPNISKYDRDTVRLDCLGLDLNRPVDSIRPGHFPILKNIRSYQDGRLEPRAGLSTLGVIASGNSTCHSIRRLNDPRTNDWTYIIGVGGILSYGKVFPFTQLSYSTGSLAFSGNPLALVTTEPQESPQSWMVIADSAPEVTPQPANILRTSLKKVNVTGTVHQFGLPAPIIAPLATLQAPSYKYTDPDFDFQYANDGALQTDWIEDGVIAGNPTLVTRVNTTISVILYDSGSTGWACIKPASMSNIGVGSILLINSGGGSAERVIVQDVHAVSTATTISSILYDSGTSGNCSLVLTNPIDNISENAFIFNSTQNEYNRILSVTNGPDGSVALRLASVLTYATGDTVQLVASFRAYYLNTHAATETITAKGAQSSFGAAGTGYLTRTAAYDLSTIASAVSATPDDYIHISLILSDPSKLTEFKLEFDCDATTNDFTKNFFQVTINPNTLTGSVQGTQTLTQALQSTISTNLTFNSVPQFDAEGNQLTEQNDPNANTIIVNQEVDLGTSQWSEQRLRMSSFIRVGTDNSRGWANIAAVRIQATVTGAVTIGFDDIQLGGGFGPDQTSTSVPYVYRYRARVSSTGTKSNPSPPIRGNSVNNVNAGGGIVPYRQAIGLLINKYALATEADVLDIERFGGNVLNWHYIGTCSNTGSFASFSDTYPDDVVITNPQTDVVNGVVGFGLDSYQPWPVKDVPATGTCNASGTSVKALTGIFNIQMSLGSTIILNSNISATVYKVISSTLLEIFESVGSLTGVSWTLPAPVITSQPLPYLWGPLDSTYFGCGDKINPGRLYFTGVDSEGSTSSDYYDVTSASEPLMNGCLYNGRSYCFSSERFFQIIPNSPGSLSRYTVQEIPGGKGLFSPWALTRIPGPYIASLYSDGIYRSDGGPQVNITNDFLNPIFPNESLLGTSFGPIGAPDIDVSQATVLRLDYALSALYFDYIDVDGGRSTLVYFEKGLGDGWFFDEYSVPITFHYEDEGSGVRALLVGGALTDAQVYKVTKNVGDDTEIISCQFRTPSRDQGDPRLNKFYGDIMLDVNPDSVNVTCTPGINNYDGVLTPTVITGPDSRTQKIINFDATNWKTARNVALDVTFNIDSSLKPLFYVYEFRSVFESAPISANSWDISPSTLGLNNFKSLGYGRFCYVSNSIVNILVTLDGADQSVLTLPNTNGAYLEHVFRFPVYKAKLYKIRISADVEFRLSGENTYIEVKEWAGSVYRQMRVFSDYSVIQG